MLKELKGREKAVLYGLQKASRIIISSISEKRGLERIGIFQRQKKNLIKTSKTDEFTFHLQNSQLLCLHNQGDDKPNSLIAADVLNYTTDFSKRNHGIIDESVFQEREVTIIGLGSGGSSTAIDLVRCGVTKLSLIDFDRVSVSNICRSPYDLFDVGMKKTEALFDKLTKINPCIQVELYDEDVLEMDSKKLMNITNQSDLIIEATDSVKSKILINGIAYHSKPVIYSSVYNMGVGGDVLFTIPGLPCFECIFNSLISEMKAVKKGEWDYSADKTKPMPALISDINVVIARSVKIALAILTADSENSFIEKITEPGCTLLLIGNEKGAVVFDRPFQEVWAETEIDPECTCQSLM